MPRKVSVDEIIAKRSDIGSDAAPIVKAAKAPASWDAKSRSARFIMNAQATDRYGDIVVTSGINTKRFEQNPVALLFHSSRSWPVGSWGNLEKILKGRPPRLEGDVMLLPEGGPVKEIDETAWMIEHGGVRACSIGFVPDWEQAEMILDEDGQPTWGLKFNACELVEASIVPVPASPESLVKSADGNMRLAAELIEDILDNWAKSPEGLILRRADFEAAYRTTTEKIQEDRVEPSKPDDEFHSTLKQALKASGLHDGGEVDSTADEDEQSETVELAADDIAETADIAEEDDADVSDTITVKIDADTSALDEKLTRSSGLLERLLEGFASLTKAKTEERIEPTVEVEKPEPADPEMVRILTERSAALRASARQDGLGLT